MSDKIPVIHTDIETWVWDELVTQALAAHDYHVARPDMAGLVRVVLALPKPEYVCGALRLHPCNQLLPICGDSKQLGLESPDGPGGCCWWRVWLVLKPETLEWSADSVSGVYEIETSGSPED